MKSVGRESPHCRKERDKDGAPVARRSRTLGRFFGPARARTPAPTLSMSIRSMTGFAQVKGQVNGQFGFTLSLKSVNHRFLDIHFRMPSDSDDLEMKLRRRLKERMARGHVELTLNVERSVSEGFSLNRDFGGRLRAGVSGGGCGVWSGGRAGSQRDSPHTRCA